MVKAYSLHIDDAFHGLCQSTAAGANSPDQAINQTLIQQAQAGVEIRQGKSTEHLPIVDWKKISISPAYLESISEFIQKTIPQNFYDAAYFDISHSEGRLAHYTHKLKSIFVKDKINLQKQRWLAHTVDIFSWYFQSDIPATQILSVGCGSGYELFFLRHKYPDAEITAVDWVNKVPKAILEKLNISFIEASVYDYLASHKAENDLIYSCHVLEHSYQIDGLMQLLHQNLKEGGFLASSIPLCGFENTKYAAFLERVLARKLPLRQLDCTLLDLGHPWKTNQHDLYHSLRKAEFQEIQILGNVESCVRGRQVSLSQWKKEANFMFFLHSVLLNPFKKILYLFMKDPLPYPVVKFNCSLDWKFEFGGGRIANFVPEVFFIARKGL
jgi:2-polyprenyl-3-methyl-5-hydroxy-6-metoxy-1,4-benzoquinol methylase